jgi:hypothetical protein
MNNIHGTYKKYTLGNKSKFSQTVRITTPFFFKEATLSGITYLDTLELYPVWQRLVSLILQ